MAKFQNTREVRQREKAAALHLLPWFKGWNTKRIKKAAVRASLKTYVNPLQAHSFSGCVKRNRFNPKRSHIEFASHKPATATIFHELAHFFKLSNEDLVLASAIPAYLKIRDNRDWKDIYSREPAPVCLPDKETANIHHAFDKKRGGLVIEYPDDVTRIYRGTRPDGAAPYFGEETGKTFGQHAGKFEIQSGKLNAGALLISLVGNGWTLPKAKKEILAGKFDRMLGTFPKIGRI